MKIYFRNRDKWRAWLEKHHAIEKEVWLVYYKKHTGKPCITYNEAVEEALCFGWIDSIVKAIDEKKYCQKFTPRKDNSKWSESNKKIVKHGSMICGGIPQKQSILISKKTMADSLGLLC